MNGGIGAEQPDPGQRFRRYGGNVGVGQTWNDEGLVFSRFVQVNANLTFLNFWNINGGAGRGFRVLDDIDTRGGPPIVSPAGTFVYFNLNSDSRKRWRVFFHVDGGRNEAGGSNLNLNPTFTIQASGRLQMSLSARYDSGTNVAQWITNRDTNGDGVVDHVYGTLERDVVDIVVRGTYAINRDLTFQAYLQPFVAVGDYENIRRLARPRSFEFEPVVIPFNPDFNTKSLRGNLVLRWEYIRGSTLFVVWDLRQADPSRPGVFSPWRDLADAFGASANHIAMVKVSYWLDR
ncbi:MAG: hypothetical protein HY657_12875 [Acidobacteria bacterium]|nr:hypothetical protein [Acidobacteriota bacterium]